MSSPGSPVLLKCTVCESGTLRKKKPASTCNTCFTRHLSLIYPSFFKLYGLWWEGLDATAISVRHQVTLARTIIRYKEHCLVLIVRSPVRISFGGGGTDLPSYYEQFGGAVLSVAINKYFYTILGTRSDGRVQVISSDLRVFETWHDIAHMPVRGSELEIPLAVLKEVGCDVAVDLFLASEIPPGTGLGSSASVCVNILKTLTNYTQRPLSKHELADRAFHIARNILG